MAFNAPLLAGFSNSPDIVPISGKLLSLALGYHYLTTTTDQQVNPKNILHSRVLALSTSPICEMRFPGKSPRYLEQNPAENARL